MKSNEFEDDPLWGLLGEGKLGKPAEVSPFFARNILREIRLTQDQNRTPAGTSFSSLLRRWRMGLVGAAMALGVAALTGTALLQDRTAGNLASQQPSDAEVISHLDELLTYEDTTVWLDQSAY